ncbi:MAG: DUF1294 domain-containing protein [Bacteroidaceae bacterium]|nr:DUF1294 domain-containing protein [Bacteroidaceae bacterium]
MEYCIIAINILAFILYGIDKFNAVRNAARVPERRLLALALAGGSAGALVAVYIFRHKKQRSGYLPFCCRSSSFYTSRFLLILPFKRYDGNVALCAQAHGWPPQ